MTQAREVITLTSAIVITVAVAVLLGRPGPSIQNAPQDTRRQQPTFRTAANYVRVDVYPTANGQIVPDLAQAEFEILEDGVPQKVDAFERVVFRAPGPEAERREPGTVRESNDAAADPRSRLFVLWLDSYHTSVDATTFWTTGGLDAMTAAGGASGAKDYKSMKPDSRVGRPLAQFLEGLIGADDLIGIMRPEMPVSSLSFRRRPSSFEEFLLTGGLWQRQDLDRNLDATERSYAACYPKFQSVVSQMIARRREHLVIEGLHDLVRHLQALREGRKAVLVVSEGWELYKPSTQLAAELDGRPPGPPAILISRGTLAVDDPQRGGQQACDRDRQMLAEMDNERAFVEMLDDANRANVTFYPIDPRGLAAGSDRPSAAATTENRMFHGRIEALRTLATATDGVASMNSNDFAKSFSRIADDMSSYYLVGYYSTNAEPDGKFRRITVRVKRPGVTVRARRGYRAATRAELDARAKASTGASKAGPDPLAAALGGLDEARLGVPVRVRTGYGWRHSPPGQAGATVWVVGELDQASARQPEWQTGSVATFTVSSVGGQTVASAEAKLSTNARSFAVQLPAERFLTSGDYTVRVAWKGEALNAGESFALSIPPFERVQGPAPGNPLVFRRGPFSRAGYQPTADPRFRRQERLRVDMPVVGSADGTRARLLDRSGKPLSLPVTVGSRDEGGATFVTAELTLAPLAVADYVIEITLTIGGREHTILTAFRIVP
jgi:VWFA-related protein